MGILLLRRVPEAPSARDLRRARIGHVHVQPTVSAYVITRYMIVSRSARLRYT
jgi:hypothetical protein